MRYLFLIPVVLLAMVLQIAASPVPNPGNQPSYHNPETESEASIIYDPGLADTARASREKDCVERCCITEEYIECYGRETCRWDCRTFTRKLWNDMDQCISDKCQLTTDLGKETRDLMKSIVRTHFCPTAEAVLPLAGTGPGYKS
ncbi:hypothetical protein TWF696_000150 [Orbilia brochopaga]|uniref:Uncharacterized protein n=1 Tax=Orbilia brochopaga TaxID=3140254 RepID=A0AAV9VBN9_9PEZI